VFLVDTIGFREKLICKKGPDFLTRAALEDARVQLTEGCFLATMGYEHRSQFKKFIALLDISCFNQNTDILEPGTILHSTPLIDQWHYVDIFYVRVYPSPSRNTESTGINSFALLSKV
jgi:hypothetical protein